MKERQQEIPRKSNILILTEWTPIITVSCNFSVYVHEFLLYGVMCYDDKMELLIQSNRLYL